MAKLPTRSPTHEDIPPGRLSSMGLEIEDIADGDQVALPALIELAEDRGRPVSHYLAAIPLATELRLAGDAPLSVRVCAGTCQRWGALDLLDHLVDRLAARPGGAGPAAPGFAIAPVSCLDRCDLAPACEVHGEHGQLVLAPATPARLDEALATLAT
ncbi:MAG TPA: (2Fe-2S) ferredoxin domain-containing protein [Kofleriaceae bacterium]|nr:(2Fe-2S) ferredoxin domain-containing protein [Kofleriaceae bacterium]